MTEATFAIANRNVVTVRLDPNSIRGQSMAGLPVLYLPFKLQLLPAGENSDVQYTVVRLAGALQKQPLGQFAKFETAPLALVPSPKPFDRHQEAFVALDHPRIKRFEDVRAGENANFQIVLSALIWRPDQGAFDVPYSSGHLEVLIPKSQWIDGVLVPWNLSHIKLVEIQFPEGNAGENFRAAYARVEEAERLFANGLYKQTLTNLRLAFEGLAKSLEFKAAGEDFFESFFAPAHQEKREKAREALYRLYRFLHLGPHEQALQSDPAGQLVVTRQDARFALIMARAIFEYITPGA
jgi:hypothetical protein